MKKFLVLSFCRVVVLSFVLFPFLFLSCKPGTSGLPGITAAGSPGEVLLVMPSPWLQGEIGEDTKAMLRMEVPALPQSEPWLRVQTVSTDDFGQFLRNTRNILIIDHNEDIYTTTSVKYAFDPYAKGQMIVTVQTPNLQSYRQYIHENGRALCELFLRNELFRMASDLTEEYSPTAMNLCEEVFGCRLNAPKDVLSYKKDENFLWLSNNAMKRRYDFALFKVPYDTTASLPSARRLIALRDSVLGKQIPGSEPPARMATSDYATEYRIAQLPSGNQFVELRGLWEMTPPDLMAGPFVAHAFFAPNEAALYYVEGFVYYPNENKRDMVRRLQATLFSFRPEEEEIYDPEPIKRIRWSTAKDLTAEDPTFATELR